jgi:hypothetical protein
MLVYPSVCENEAELCLLHDGAATLDYWRCGVYVCVGNHAPPAPIGAMLVAWIRPKASGGFRTPARIFYLNCFGPPDHLDGIDNPGDDGGCLVDPASVIPGQPHCEPPKQFGRRSPRGPIEARFQFLLANRRKEWETYAERHGFTLPTDHREQWNGDHIPF